MRAKTELDAGQQLLGRFWLASTGNDPAHRAAGVLNWSTGDGVVVRLIGPLVGWPRGLAGALTVHGETVDGEKLSLIGCRIVSISVGGVATLTLSGTTLLLGDHATADTRWRTSVITTANLHEWSGETGLQVPDWDHAPTGHTTRVQMTWEVPHTRHVRLPTGELLFSPSMETEWAFAPEWSIRTGTDVMVKPKRPAKLDVLYRTGAAPLLSLIVVAGDRPDSITSEVVADAKLRRRARVLRSGEVVSPRDWRPDNAHLFTAAQLPDFATAVERWFAIWAATEPALGTFAEAINAGNTYSPGRFLQVVTALESYGRRWRKDKRILLKVLEGLRAYAGIPARSTGCTQRNLKLIVASRNFHAHLNQPNYGFSLEFVQLTTFESTRRATALMQACILRELGFSARATRKRLDEHYRNWPVPMSIVN
jgi:ApeA N-terminal domain 1